MKKTLGFLKRWGNDYTFTIYILKLLGAVVTILYYTVTLFNREKTKEFNKKKNFFSLKRKELIESWNKPADDAFKKKFLQGNRYLFKDISFPVIKNTYLMRTVYEDSLQIYTEYNDNYSYTIVDKLEKEMPEGSYCYVSKKGESILVTAGDVVIDAGAWIGDFSAYAAKKGAYVYAFEPSSTNRQLLKQTIAMNSMEKNISIVPYGLGEKEEVIDFLENEEGDNSGGSTFRVHKKDANKKLEITTLDAWVENNSINKIDFIKSDIEGFERFLLRGAKKVLQRYAPILSICTYHLPDDREVIKGIILEANPNYKIIQRKMKLFAYVDKNN
jgi:FkbM family methyltransferase